MLISLCFEETQSSTVSTTIHKYTQVTDNYFRLAKYIKYASITKIVKLQKFNMSIESHNKENV